MDKYLLCYENDDGWRMVYVKGLHSYDCRWTDQVWRFSLLTKLQVDSICPKINSKLEESFGICKNLYVRKTSDPDIQNMLRAFSKSQNKGKVVISWIGKSPGGYLSCEPAFVEHQHLVGEFFVDFDADKEQATWLTRNQLVRFFQRTNLPPEQFTYEFE